MGARGDPWPLIGRGDDLAWAESVLSPPDQRGLVIAGPPGQGKTRLGRACLDIAAAQDRLTASVIATRAAASTPLGAFAHLLPDATGRPDSPLDLIRSAIRAVADLDRSTPPVLLVDDAHLLDPASATVVQQLAATGAATTVVTVRTGEPAPDAVTSLWKERLSERLDLGPLRPEEVGELAEAIVGAPLDRASTWALWRAGAGNALVVCELVLAALEGRDVIEEQGVLRLACRPRLSPRLTELIEARLAALNEAQLGAMEVLAVGEPLPLSLLSRLSSEQTVAELESKRFVTVGQEWDQRLVQLAHPIFAEVLRARMTAIRAVAVSRALADAAEAGTGAHHDPLRLAVWRLDGGGRADPDLTLRAARLAYFRHDDELAARLGGEAAKAGARIDGSLVRAQALTELGCHAEAEAVLARLPAASTTDRQRAMIARHRSFALFWGLDRRDDALRVLQDAEGAVAAENWQQELRGERAVLHLLAGEPATAAAIAQPLVDGTSGRAFVTAAVGAVPALALTGRCREASDLARRAYVAHAALGDEEALARPGTHLVGRALALIEAGEVDEAIAMCEAGHAEAMDISLSSAQAWFALLAGRTALIKGMMATAARWFAEAGGTFGRLGQRGPRRWCLAGKALAAASSADTAASTAAVDSLDATPTTAFLLMEADVDRARAWHLYLTGHQRAARHLLHEAADRAATVGANTLAAAALHDVARLGAPEEVTEQLTDHASRVDGDLAGLRAQHAAALSHGDAVALDDVARGFEEMGAFLFAAEASAAASAAHRAAGDARAATRQSAVAAALVERCEGASTPALAWAGPAPPLTRREREVAELVVAGLPNKAIAKRLGLARRTVENHLQRVYTKGAINSREELVILMRNGVPRTGAE